MKRRKKKLRSGGQFGSGIIERKQTAPLAVVLGINRTEAWIFLAEVRARMQRDVESQQVIQIIERFLAINIAGQDITPVRVANALGASPRNPNKPSSPSSSKPKGVSAMTGAATSQARDKSKGHRVRYRKANTIRASKSIRRSKFDPSLEKSPRASHIKGRRVRLIS